jgi:hypothetical protein
VSVTVPAYNVLELTVMVEVFPVIVPGARLAIFVAWSANADFVIVTVAVPVPEA